MPTLLEKIEADAAGRLLLPPDRRPAQELARYKGFLKIESHRLKMLHRAGAGGREICQARAAVLDVLSKYILQAVREGTRDEAMFRRMEAVVLARCVRGFEDEYIAARLADQEARRAKFGNSATMQEPNIKNGCGGLRDFQNLIWMAFFKYRTRSLAELEKRELISESERKQLRSEEHTSEL